MSEDTKEVMHERLKLAAENYSTAHLGGDHVTMADIGYAHGHVFQLALDYIAELERALAAAEARERKSYLLLARWLDKKPHDGGTLAAETRSHLDAILDAIHALGRERNA